MDDVPRRLYLAGPMSGHPQHNFPLFNRAATLLREQGFEVFNPAENKDDGVLRSRAFYMWQDIPALMNSEAIAVLPGWYESRGASLEMWIALDLDIPAFDCKLQDGVITLEPIRDLPTLRLPFIVESRRAGSELTTYVFSGSRGRRPYVFGVQARTGGMRKYSCPWRVPSSPARARILAHATQTMVVRYAKHVPDNC